MKKLFFLSLIYLSVQSCSIPNYLVQNKAQTTGLDFTKGKWLINEVDCPGNVYKELTDMSLKDFGNYLDNRLYPVHELKEIILPQKLVLILVKKL